MPLPVLAEVLRSGFLEGRHRGSLVVLGPAGRPLLALGDPDAAVFPRSSNKPMQAVGMLRAGLSVDGPELAIASASHSGQPGHVAVVRGLLAAAGLDESALGNTPDLPLDAAAAAALLRAGGDPDRVHQNCSGKHAAMLATCVSAGWPTAGYLDPAHPLQASLLATFEDIVGTPASAVGVDGCGAPLFAASLRALAAGFGRLVTAAPGSPERRVADAMRAHPQLVGGTGRDVTALMAGVPGLLAKDGAEGVYAAALPDGSAVALKIDDGASRARVPVLVAALGLLGRTDPVLAELAETSVLGGGRPVGAVRAVPWPPSSA